MAEYRKEALVACLGFILFRRNEEAAEPFCRQKGNKKMRNDCLDKLPKEDITESARGRCFLRRERNILLKSKGKNKIKTLVSGTRLEIERRRIKTAYFGRFFFCIVRGLWGRGQ